MLKEIKDLKLIIRFRRRRSDVQKMDVLTFSDASYIIVSGREYGKKGVLSGIKCVGEIVEHEFLIIDWGSTNQLHIIH